RAHHRSSHRGDFRGTPARSARPAAVSTVALFGTTFQNPILLAAGTAGFGRELDDVIDLDLLGGIVTKAVTPEPRQGHPALRVAEFRGGMLNAVGACEPGGHACRRARAALARATSASRARHCERSGSESRRLRAGDRTTDPP